MGKPYSDELKEMPAVYDWAAGTPIDELLKFVKKSKRLPLYAVGSGGSFSPAVFASLLHQLSGTISKCLTPLEFLESHNIDSNCAILIITAGGNNKDVLSAFDRAIHLKPKTLGVLCASTNNKLTRRIPNLPNIFVHARDPPTGRDGFLATNSLIASVIWIARTYIEGCSMPYFIPKFSELCSGTPEEFQGFKDRDTVILMHDIWGKTAAVDIESKLTEAGLASVQMADYRNFAHGRHNWIDKNKERTALVALVTPHSRQLAGKTLRHIPKYTPTVSLSSRFDGPMASLELLVRSLFLTEFFGRVRKIDPGRPGVAEFGRKMYHLSIPNINPTTITKFEELALRRKFACSDYKNMRMRIKSLQRFIASMSSANYSAVIFDYDGTICNPENRYSIPSKKTRDLLVQLLEKNIIMGVATGRGRSVRKAMQKIIPKRFWSSVLVGYHNGAAIGELGKNNIPSNERTVDSTLLQIVKFLRVHDVVLGHDPTTGLNQISFRDIPLSAVELINKIRMIEPAMLENIKIVESSHSVDILPKNVSKLNLFKHMKSQIPKKHQILCIGDRGKWPGNDYELLSTPHSLSVDDVSDDPNSCWNLLPAGTKGEAGTAIYLKSLKVNQGYLGISIKVQ